jgi:DNA-binding response OmpR family regulator
MNPRILVLEDEKNVGSTLVERLQQENYDVVWVKNMLEARAEIKARPFSLALLDVGLPDGSGFDLAQEMRSLSQSTAIIFLTAHGRPEDRVRGLTLGAEDYIVKPFHLKELLLRIKNGLRRANFVLGGTEGVVKLGKAEVDFSKFTVFSDGNSQSLTHKEWALLKLLSDRKGKVVSRDEILNVVWAEDEFPTPRTVDNFIVKLRKLVESSPETPSVIKTVRGVGYQLE